MHRYTLAELKAWVDMPLPERYGCIDIDERRVIPDIEIREAVIKACGLRSISEFQLLTLERRKTVIREVMLLLDVRPRQLARVTGMNYETIRNIAKKWP
ncbi:MAG: hypothetical protein J6W43_10620 [Prevotella sp.]|nr:hypothetical protein [Prevotella sp.]